MRCTVDTAAVKDFLAQRRIAVVGASADQRSFGNTVYVELRKHAYDAIPVNPTTEFIDDQPCYADLASVPGDIDGVVIMVSQAKAPDIIRACRDRGIHRVWLFKGLGGPGALSEQAVQLCHDNNIDVVSGACPLMFLEPVTWFHRAHRGMRRINRSLVDAS
jgi:uncharacterized protein